ncbi:Vivid protein light receptor [Podospora pseudocomata]|uniref:Vivid protein light receptor n=1 Tax=Podospora pseudocomata TaxID=2093779 RepID=A0ABR0GGJ7_9PEZI|nr:Vivid protein light receptor [Podospora pseudocomata]
MSNQVNTWDGNSWEGRAIEHYGGRQLDTQIYDPIIFPGLYSNSGLDIMSVLQISLHSRPNPQVDIGAVDMSCPIIVCDLLRPDQPIIYASDSFLELTGYNRPEVLERNCRFMQAPGGQVKPKSARKYVDEKTIKKMRKSVDRNSELQIPVTNFKKDGQQFTNYLTMIPLQFNSHQFNISVGFQCEMNG